ncbi:hypothetical protein LTS10_013210 [Elasticomyces elasticus]|nr:hypothetical protein LTS10_013210 [Elasticomyces elasticus]
MSFGFSPSDIVALINIASKTHQGWKKACGKYADVTVSLDSLLTILQRIENEAKKQGSVLVRSSKDAFRLQDVLSSILSSVQKLYAVAKRFKSLGLGRSREKNWDKIRFGVKDLSDLQLKLNQRLAVLTVYLNTVGLSALTRIGRGIEILPEINGSIDALSAEIRAGRRVASVMTTYDEDEKDVWHEFRRELIGEGMRSSTIHKYKPQIKQYVRHLAKGGLLEEDKPPADTEAEVSTIDASNTPRDASGAEQFSEPSEEGSDGRQPVSSVVDSEVVSRADERPRVRHNGSGERNMELPLTQYDDQDASGDDERGCGSQAEDECTIPRHTRASPTNESLSTKNPLAPLCALTHGMTRRDSDDTSDARDAAGTLVIQDTRWKFQPDDVLPPPRQYVGGSKKYRVGTKSSMPLDSSQVR